MSAAGARLGPEPLPQSILCAPTPPAWIEAAAVRLPELLVDHANCEKKAASSALALIFAYPEDTALVLALSRLAREELRHFEQVHRAMRQLAIRAVRQRPGRYAHELRRAMRTTHPERKLDLLLAAALIEARSAERFALLAGRLPTPLAALYREFASSEARHFELYLGFARERAPSEWRTRLAGLAALEAQLATTPDPDLRFHSGPPAVN
ncbi:MAG TPA: tRNA isopentenyl-2-thiomethyl-A-37 hydroxylase MiaE [Steroidobacteraceae bacterium]|jgi:tRNA-(ms[2]io[6]A)-hydroxylase